MWIKEVQKQISTQFPAQTNPHSSLMVHNQTFIGSKAAHTHGVQESLVIKSLLAHVQFFIYQSPYVFFHRAAVKEPFYQSVHTPGTALIQEQNVALGVVEPHSVHMGLPLKPVQVSLDGTPPFYHISCTTQLANLLRVHSIPSSVSLIKMLKNTKTDP